MSSREFRVRGGYGMEVYVVAVGSENLDWVHLRDDKNAQIEIEMG